MKKTILVFLSMLMVGLPLFARGGSDQRNAGGAGKTTITYWHIFPEGDAFKPVHDELIRRFNASQNEVYVEDLGISFFDYLSKIDTALPAGTGPDVGFNGLDSAPRRAEAGAIVNLSKYIAADNLDMTQYYKFAQDNVAYQGGVYGLPFAWGGRLLVYNKQMFREAGLDPNAPPKTLRELEQYSDKLTKIGSNGQIQVLGFHPALGNSSILSFVISRGGDFFDRNQRPTLNGTINLQALEWYVNMTNRHGAKQVQSLQAASSTTGIDPFLAGFVAMEVNVADFYKKLSESNIDFGLAPIPTPDSSTRGSWAGGFDLEIINHNSEARAQAAWKFIKFMTSEESQLYWAVENKWPTANQRALEKYSGFKTDPNWKVIIDEMPYAYTSPYVANASGWLGLLTPEVEAAQLELKTPRQALNDAQAAIELEIRNYEDMH
jgi:multiple sugar transport system substrate-binding protein